MIEEKIPIKILKQLKNQADDTIVISRYTDSNQIKFSNNKVSTIQNWVNNSITIFVAKNKKVLATTILDFSEASIKKSLNLISKNLELMHPNGDYMGIAEGPFKYKKISDLYDKKILEFDFSDKLESGINKALEIGAKRNSGILETAESQHLLLTSNNVEAEEKLSQVHFSVRSMYDKEASGHITNSSRTLKNIYIEKSCEESAVSKIPEFLFAPISRALFIPDSNLSLKSNSRIFLSYKSDIFLYLKGPSAIPI